MLQTSQSRKGAAAANTPQQVKLRSACNKCCIAKVKCSGEKTGCARCRNTGDKCVYMESRVGKVQGPRRKTRDTSRNEPRHHQQDRTGLSLAQPASVITVATGDELQEHDPVELIRWSGDWHLAQLETSSPAEFRDNLSSGAETRHNSTDVSMYTSPEGFGMPVVDPNLENFLLEFPVPRDSLEPTSTASSGDASASPSLGMRPRTEADSQCCLDCCHIIADLENYIMSDLRNFKIILGIIRNVLQRLAQLIEHQQSSVNHRCLLLLKTLMYQILELMEAGRKSIIAEKTRERQRSLASGGTGLGLGDYSIDAEEQSTLRVQTVIKEVRRATELLSKMKSLSDGSGPLSDRTARENHYIDLEDRFRGLEALLRP
ncbi:hypothetical protein PFICI_09670 [Pestalotiopsis fici W106-1]|uniref:Zn(2)-C6 fungal-type domain-containing protein n=1 Tax=Pestalotiopsis fici (strain W106-1 / CGMCC3.15140) TaxID=1229662 RepID=W3WUQ8_PESFW|nr:uncharacterized protein PFICI_09670 [Pestalotiopsis fici W106-1]ETS77608.1 hypothetical protein PFICI_09670 [Pestalotiopsis fici W106-1]